MTNLETIDKWESIRADVMAIKRGEQEAPLPFGVKPFATRNMLEKIFDDTDKAMVFSHALEKAFQETSIKLKDDETYACMLYVVKKPRNLSEVAGPTPEPSIPEYMLEAIDPTPEPADIMAKMAAQSHDDFPFMEIISSVWRSIRYKVVMEPAIMKKVMKKREDDKIDY